MELSEGKYKYMRTVIFHKARFQEVFISLLYHIIMTKYSSIITSASELRQIGDPARIIKCRIVFIHFQNFYDVQISIFKFSTSMPVIRRLFAIRYATILKSSVNTSPIPTAQTT